MPTTSACADGDPSAAASRQKKARVTACRPTLHLPLFGGRLKSNAADDNARMRLLILAAALPPGVALGQPWPAKPFKLVTPFPPGGSADVIARLIGHSLAAQLGQPVVIDNRPGAGGVGGNEYAAKQPPDGYTLLLINGAYPVQAAMLKTLPFDPLADIAMVSMLTTYPFVISVRADSAFRTLPELIAYAKAHPGKLNYPSSGVGTVHHLSGELLNAMAGIEMVHVPFR